MCELLVRVVDKVNDDFYKNCQCTKRGDVIVAQEDGWAWGKEELANPDWRIVSLPGIPRSDVLALLAPEMPVDPKNPSPTLQRRAFQFDIDNLPITVSRGGTSTSTMQDASRSTPVIDFALSPTDVQALILAKPSIADPSVIGVVVPATVIG